MALEAGASVDDCEVEGSMLYHLNNSIFCVLISLFILRDLDYDTIEVVRTIVAYLVDIGFSINFMDIEESFPILYAARWNLPLAIPFLQILIGNGADPTRKDKYGHGALHIAVDYGHWDKLYDDINMDLERFNTAWEGSDALKGLEDKLLFLLHAGCDSEAIDHAGRTVWDCAEQHGLSEVWDAALSRFDEEERDLVMRDD